MSLTRELETLFFILLASIIGLFGVYYMRQPNKLNHVNVATSLPTFVLQVTPTPTPLVLPKPTNVFWNSSDGKEKVVMTTTVNANTTKTYSFAATNLTTNIVTPIFTKTLPATSTMAIPFNTFSPDDGYLYLTEIDGTEKHYFVFKSTGEAFANGENFLDVTPLFANFTSNYTISDITGWADPSLLVINTKTTDGATGPSFWFEVPSKSFIRLSTLFE